MKDALVCSLSGIGNAITTLPLIQTLHGMGYVVDVRAGLSRGSGPLFKAHPCVRKVHDVGEVGIKSRSIACCTHICQHYHQGCRLGREQVLMIEPGRVKDFSVDSMKRYYKHEIEHNMDLARDLGYKGPTPLPQIPFVPYQGKFSERRMVVLGVGYCKDDKHSERKHWGNENFARLADLLLGSGFAPVVLGDEGDRKNVEKIAKLSNGDGVRCVVNLPLLEALGFFAGAVACVTNETMLVVASAAFRVPCLSLIFKEALHHPPKTYPYPDGVALFGFRTVLDAGTVFDYFLKLRAGGTWKRWTKVQEVD